MNICCRARPAPIHQSEKCRNDLPGRLQLIWTMHRKFWSKILLCFANWTAISTFPKWNHRTFSLLSAKKLVKIFRLCQRQTTPYAMYIDPCRNTWVRLSIWLLRLTPEPPISSILILQTSAVTWNFLQLCLMRDFQDICIRLSSLETQNLLISAIWSPPAATSKAGQLI